MLRPVGSPISPVMSPIRKMTVWPKILKMLHLAKQDRVAEMEIGRGRIETGFYAQRAAERQALAQVLFANAVRPGPSSGT